MKRLGRRSSLLLRVGVATLHAEVRRRGVVAWGADAGYSGPAELPGLIGRLAGDCAVPCRRLRVALEHPPVQLRTLTDLPPVRPSELSALVAHHAGRFFRKNGGPLVTDAMWLTQDGARVARAAAVEEAMVEAIAAGARAAGLTLDTVAVADSELPLALLPGAERASRARAERRRVRVLGAVSAGVWVLVGALFVSRLVWERRAVERELLRLQAPLAAVLAARRELHDVEAALSAVARADNARSRGLAVLASVTAALPDSAVLTSVSWKEDGSLVLSGAARQAAQVLARLERVTRVGAPPAFEGPVVREAVAGREWERFTIAFKGRAK